MATVSITDARKRFFDVARRIEATGEAVTITRNGGPILDLIPYRRKGGVDFEAGEAFLRRRGVDKFFKHVADDFDEPLPEDFLIRGR